MPPPQQGRGTHTSSNGTYTGEWRGGKRNGQGAMAYDTGDRCVRHAQLRWAQLAWPCQGQAAGGRRRAEGGGRSEAGGKWAGGRAATDAGAGGGL